MGEAKWMQKNQLSEPAKGKIKVVLLVAIVTIAVGIFMYYFTFTSYGYSNWTSLWNFSINSLVMISINPNSVDFGTAIFYEILVCN